MPDETPTPTADDATPEGAPAAVSTKPAPEAVPARETELLERLARLQADFDNFRRRTREDASQASARGKIDFVKALLPVLDNLDRALQHGEDKGLQLLSRQLQEVLTSQGLAILDPAGEPFDAKLHEAIASETKEGVASGSVVTTVERGYMLDGRIVRPARVIVAA